MPEPIEQPHSVASLKDLPAPSASPIGELFRKFGLDLNIGGTVPLEVFAGKVVEYFQSKRESMSQSNRDRWDNLELTAVENWHDGIVDLVNKGGAHFKKVGEAAVK